MAELGLTITGLTLQGFHLYNQIRTFHTTFQDSETTFKHIRSELGSTNNLVSKLDRIVSNIADARCSTLRGLLPNLAGLKFEIDMLRDVYTALSKLLNIYHEPRCDDFFSYLEPLNFVSKQMGFGKRLRWMSGDHDQAKKLQQMLVGHKANLSFAIQAAEFALQISEARKRELSHDDMDQKIEQVKALIHENQGTLRQIQAASTSSTPCTPASPCSTLSSAALSEEGLRRRLCDLETRNAALAAREERYRKKENTNKLIDILKDHLSSLELRRRNSIKIDNLEITDVPLVPATSASIPITTAEDHVNESFFSSEPIYQEAIDQDMRLYDLSRDRTTEAEIKRRSLVMILIVLNGMLSTGTNIWWAGYFVVNFFVWLVLFLSVMFVWIVPDDELSTDVNALRSAHLKKE